MINLRLTATQLHNLVCEMNEKSAKNVVIKVDENDEYTLVAEFAGRKYKWNEEVHDWIKDVIVCVGLPVRTGLWRGKIITICNNKIRVAWDDERYSTYDSWEYFISCGGKPQ